MKKIVGFASLIWVFTACTSSDTLEMGQKTEMEVQSVVDMGDVVYGENVVAEFKVTNQGKYPLLLSDVKGSCTCTVADWPKEPIAPGESEVLKATVKTTGSNPGPLKKDIRITANTSPATTVVLIKANVVRK